MTAVICQSRRVQASKHKYEHTMMNNDKLGLKCILKLYNDNLYISLNTIILKVGK